VTVAFMGARKLGVLEMLGRLLADEVRQFSVELVSRTARSFE
jgi:hypothetical protein